MTSEERAAVNLTARLMFDPLTQSAVRGAARNNHALVHQGDRMFRCVKCNVAALAHREVFFSTRCALPPQAGSQP